MVDVVVTAPVRLVQGTPGIDLIAGGSAITTGQTWEVNVASNEKGLVLVVEDSGGSGSVLTVDAGDYPPSAISPKGALAYTLTASDLRILILEHGRHMQNDGKITGSNTGGTIRLYACRLPLGA